MLEPVIHFVVMDSVAPPSTNNSDTSFDETEDDPADAYVDFDQGDEVGSFLDDPISYCRKLLRGCGYHTLTNTPYGAVTATMRIEAFP